MSVPQPGGVGEGAATLIAEHRSAPLVAIARTGLETSDNPLSEMLALAVARSRLGRAPTIFEAAAEVNAFWRQKGVEVALEDGSGLCARSRLSPRAAAAILLEARRLPGAPFFSLLPGAGLSGTLGRRLSAPDVALRAWAKTGTLSYAAGLAGQLFTRSGRELIFAAFVAEPTLRDAARAHPPSTRADADAAEAVDDAWLVRARALQDSLVTLWIARH